LEEKAHCKYVGFFKSGCGSINKINSAGRYSNSSHKQSNLQFADRLIAYYPQNRRMLSFNQDSLQPTT
ncbi:MAG: hypothetical protein ACWGO1_13985, partial [Anaerolineales bacterium]